MKPCNDSGASQASAEGPSATARRELKRQLDIFVGDLARDVFGDGGEARNEGDATSRGSR